MPEQVLQFLQYERVSQINRRFYRGYKLKLLFSMSQFEFFHNNLLNENLYKIDKAQVERLTVIIDNQIYESRLI